MSWHTPSKVGPAARDRSAVDSRRLIVLFCHVAGFERLPGMEAEIAGAPVGVRQGLGLPSDDVATFEFQCCSLTGSCKLLITGQATPVTRDCIQAVKMLVRSHVPDCPNFGDLCRSSHIGPDSLATALVGESCGKSLTLRCKGPLSQRAAKPVYLLTRSRPVSRRSTTRRRRS
jgi:hypothetical protein